ncbi:hypothetical protein C8R45DRAFT_830461 [Mycena sanguinolenta]|nr:hypothetical protein C8R45DRAFT_830461 [Mycena sanguinolenta]
MQLLLSSHCLALERLRWVEFRRPVIPRDLRVCRFCKAEIESPEHALLECTAELQLVKMREDFLRRMRNGLPGLPRPNSMSSARFFTHMISYRETISLVAKFAYEVTQLFEATSIYVPPLPLHCLTLPRRNDYCTISFNSNDTRHRPRNFRKFSTMSRVTESIFECAKEVTKSTKNDQKIRFFARALCVVF